MFYPQAGREISQNDNLFWTILEAQKAFYAII